MNERADLGPTNGAVQVEESARKRDLADIVGTWCEDEAFDRALADQDTFDDELWPKQSSDTK